MKNITVRYIGQNPTPKNGWVIESVEDIIKLAGFLDEKEKGIFMKFLKSNESAERLNHIVGGFAPIEKGIGTLACAYGANEGTNPLYSIPKAKGAMLTTAYNLLKKGRVFMNQNGGMCLLDNTFEILEESEFVGFENKEERVKFVEGAKVINLENDPYIESAAHEYMEKRWGKFVSLKELLLFNKAQLQRIFEKFVSMGGETVYVYTTGMNTGQMYEYSEAALKAGLKHFVFDFNMGISGDINSFVDWLKQHANVEIVKEIS